MLLLTLLLCGFLIREARFHQFGERPWIPAHTNGSTGALGRKIPRVVVKTVADRMTPWGQPVLDDHSGYKDNVRVMDCRRFWLRLHLPLPHGWCHRVWMVKDWTGWGGVIFTWFLIVFGEIVFFVFVLLKFAYPVYAAFNGLFSFTCAMLGFVAHVRATFTDPVSA